MRATAAPWDALLEGEELAHLEQVPARPAREVPLPSELAPELVSALVGRGITALYSHQALAFEAASRGEHVLVATGTASGKTLAFNLPVLQALVADPRERALYLYPTKAVPRCS